jgi:hypothetical protein
LASVAGVTIANGADNISVYTPMFRTIGLSKESDRRGNLRRRGRTLAPHRFMARLPLGIGCSGPTPRPHWLIACKHTGQPADPN